MAINRQVLEDLEFPALLEFIAGFAGSESGKDAVRALHPIPDFESKLILVHEYKQSFGYQNRFPSHEVYNIEQAFVLWKIENSLINPELWVDIRANLQNTGELIKFFKKQKSLYPAHYHNSERIPYSDIPYKKIRTVISRQGDILDSASEELHDIRSQIKEIQSEINHSFNITLKRYDKLGYLDEIKESVVDGMRVLAVSAAHKAKIKGSVTATSKNANILYILPREVQPLIRRLEESQALEKNEILRILRKLTEELRPFSKDIEQQFKYLIEMDVFRALALFAKDINAVLPKIHKDNKIIKLINAYHPLLLIQNRKDGLPVIPQDIELHEKQRVMVISGPNAGGKSITLKMVGLLQIMLQSGILIPADQHSEMSFFKTILSDIGDHQSIENHLSTYSYRLHKMSRFLRLCNKDTLFLIDEFGTGSDPELGGALAEVLLEDFFQKGAYGVITTHYVNIKTLADRHEGMINANMRFDKRKLQALYRLVTGEAGSSFTFEVARRNKIPYALINQAKKRVEKAKVRLDKTIVKLQKERKSLEKEKELLETQRLKAQEHVKTLDEHRKKEEERLHRFDELYEYQQKMLRYGRQCNELIQHYFQTGNKKTLVSSLMKWIEQEKLKKEKNKQSSSKKNSPPSKTAKKLQKTEKEIKKKLQIRAKTKKKQPQKTPVVQLQTGDTVRIKDSFMTGIITKLEKDEAFVQAGQVTLRIPKKKLEVVKKA